MELETAGFECEVSKPNLKVKWFKDGEELKASTHFTMDTMGQKHMLTIRESAVDDQAKYTIEVEEGVESSANLTVEGQHKTEQYLYRLRCICPSRVTLPGTRATFHCIL